MQNCPFHIGTGDVGGDGGAHGAGGASVASKRDI